jgi:DNA-binding transcriptional LysR family regulator
VHNTQEDGTVRRTTRRYKELTLQQLRSLCETARQGSFVAAARTLDLSQPTVWKQVHALEREFGVRLVDPHGRGCKPTAAGQLLVEMVGPAVEAITTVANRFRAALADEGEQLTVAVTPRMLLDEMASCLPKFHARSPKTRFTFLELVDELVAGAILEHQADFGFTPTPLTQKQLSLLAMEPSYALEARLIAPQDHPLARRRTVRPRDLAGYPIVNRSPTGSSHYPHILLELLGFASSIRRFVKLGYGIGLIFTVPSVPPDPDLHERSMQRYIEPVTMSLIRRRGGYVPPAGEEFIRLVRRELGAGLP